MTAVLAYLRSLSVAEWLGIAAASWLIVGSLVALPFGRMIRRADDTQPEFVDAEDTRWLLLLPPVPAPRPRESDLDWLFDQPDEVWLTDPVVRDRCRQIEIAEGWASK